MSTKQIKFIIAAAAQTVLILGIIAFKLAVLSGGNDVLLKIKPVDPRDMLRGDYVTFQYDISDVSSYYAGKNIMNGDSVYVVLSQSGKYWSVKKVQKTRPAENELFIKGKVESGGLPSPSDTFAYRDSNASEIHIVYGVEQYFIPEGKGRNFSFAGKEAVAQVVVDGNGNAALKQIYVNDKPWP